MPGSVSWFLWNFATWLTLGAFGEFATGEILNPDYLSMLSSAWGTMSGNPYPTGY